MANVLLRLLLQKGVPANFVQQVFPEFPVQQWQLEQLTGISIAHHRPVDPAQEANRKNVGRGKVDEADSTHQEMVAGFPRQGR